MEIVGKIIKKNLFAHLLLQNNQIQDQGLRELAIYLKDSQSIVHLSLSGNQITQESSVFLFKQLEGHQYLTSIDLLNKDCASHKIRIGYKGA